MHHDPKTCEYCLEYPVMKAATFPPGPWHDEPDRQDFTHASLPCFIKRNGSGCWCGYVGVPRHHPDYEVDFGEVDAKVHGGLTYSDKCNGCLCHVPAPGESDDVWWLGFDCNHSYDWPHLGMKYRDLNFVLSETRSLAEQLAQRIP